ncbi:hypothetical protein ACFLS7_06725 [Bacteroidota bacterium]
MHSIRISLSKYLLEKTSFDPWFVEIDRDSVAYLKEEYPAITDQLIEADFLKMDLAEFYESAVGSQQLAVSSDPVPS